MPVRVEAVPVWAVGLALVGALLAAWLLSAVARFLLRGRASLGTATSIVIAMLGTAVGLILTGWLAPSSPVYGPLAIGLSLGVSVAFMAAYAAVAAHFQKPQRATLAELVAAGESTRVEFKSTARVNLHTGRRDDKMEQVVAKTVAAFLNADGGSLVIGVDDAGNPLGLASDFATIKAPDADRFELWLRDFLTSTLGQNAAALVEVDFAQLPVTAELPATPGEQAAGGGTIVTDHSVAADLPAADQSTADLPTGEGTELACRVTARPSPRPVYLRGKGAVPELWVRTGNSTRQLSVDEATEYVMHRWPLNLGSSIAAQLRAAVRFSEQR